MLRSIGGVIAGILVGAFVVFVVEMIGHLIFPPPPGVNAMDPEQLKTIIDEIPIGAKIAVIIGWFAGVFAGGSIGLAIGLRWAPIAWVVAATLFAMAAMSLIQIPHPWWMVVGAVIATLAGGHAAIKLMRAGYARPAEKKTFI